MRMHVTMRSVSAMLAIGFGLVAGIAEVARNYGGWQWWPFWLVDFIAALLLILGGTYALRNRSSVFLTGAWGFSTAMLYMSFFSHLRSLQGSAGDSAHTGPVDESLLTFIIGVFLALSTSGFLLSMLSGLYETKR